METIVQKWGNSLGIRIPSMLAKVYKLEPGSLVDIADDKGRIVITPSSSYPLQKLLEGINADNLHEAVDSGDQVGAEAW